MIKRTLSTILVGGTILGAAVSIGSISHQKNSDLDSGLPSIIIPMQIPFDCEKNGILNEGYLIENGQTRFYLNCKDSNGDIHTYLADKNNKSSFEEKIIKKSFYKN